MTAAWRTSVAGAHRRAEEPGDPLGLFVFPAGHLVDAEVPVNYPCHIDVVCATFPHLNTGDPAGTAGQPSTVEDPLSRSS
ncbi:hypothetical protein Ate01nite_14490 [Actinoplanes teichomyceticus]|nr:hypothetical protein Ate01nite_14490 [Actinoplanes teichomyceticus]